MPTNDFIQIRLPRAMDRGRGVIAVRTYDGQLYVKRRNAFVQVGITEIHYSPAWAKVQASITVTGREIFRVSGDNGKVEIEYAATEQDPIQLLLENYSIDTDVLFIVRLRGWQFGEV